MRSALCLISVSLICAASVSCMRARATDGANAHSDALASRGDAPPRLSSVSQQVKVRVDAAKQVSRADRRKLVATNIAAWDSAELFKDAIFRQRLRDLGPTFLRIPGGSWGDAMFWNGNGVRTGNQVDPKKHNKKPFSPWSAPYGTWNIDYSGYSPGFMLKNRFELTDWHGHVDVKTMHEFVRDTGNEGYVIVNAGLGSPRDAAEWVKWANQTKGYGVRYWEVGNELGGSWEAGHFLPNGKELDGTIFWHRYAEFAKAMKAVDPTIKVGCMDWLEPVLANAGDLVDFVSVHTYPTNGGDSDEQLYDKLSAVHKEVEPVRALIQKYQPARASQIEIGYSEWNMGWPDLRGALWHAAWIGEMLKHGVAFAEQFDAPGMVVPQRDDKWNFLAGKPPFIKSTYWAAWLWRQAMGDTLLESSVTSDPRVLSYATRTTNGVSLMLLNTHRDDAVRLELELAGFDSGAQARALTLSRREYFWLNEHAEAKADEMKNPPLWNVGPSSRLMPFAEARQFELPPDSITVIQIPQNGAAPPAELKPAPTAAVAPAPNAPLELRVPPQLYSGDTAEAWVFSRHMNGAAAIAFPRENGTIRVNGALKSDRSSVRLSEGAGRFLLTATGAGKAEVEVGAGRDRASAKLTLIDSVPRPRVFWEFEDEQPRDMHSHWKLLTDASVRANQRVLRVDLGGDDPSKSKKRELVVLDKLPGRDGLLKENVRGVVFDLKLSPDFRCADRGASVQLVLQSPRNYWMMLGSIALAGHAEWQTHELITQDQALIRAMPEIYNVWFVLNANAAVFGSIYIDRVGFMVR